MHTPDWVDHDNAALFTDLYQLTMLQAYYREGMNEPAVFDLFVRRLGDRNYLVACGLPTVLDFLEKVRFTPETIDYVASIGGFGDDFLEYLATFRFEGDVYAVREGTPVFEEEPILEVVAPIGQAQLVETFLLNQITFQTNVATKASRVRHAAGDRIVADFGMRRMHAADAAIKAARAYHIAGIDSTSNVLAGHLYGIPVTGTMAHSYIEAHDLEEAAFQAFSEIYPETILLVDTYDTLEGVEKVVELSRERGEDFAVRGIRLDSGDLGQLAKDSRRMLDEAGLQDVMIFASGSLDEYKIRDLLAGGAPIDGFGVGTKMGTVSDQPYLDSAYKLTGYAGEPRMKLSSEKSNLPGRKQVYRIFEDGIAVRDVIAVEGESAEAVAASPVKGGSAVDVGASLVEGESADDAAVSPADGEPAAGAGASREDGGSGAGAAASRDDEPGAGAGASPLEAEPLLELVMHRGMRTEAGTRSLEEARAHAAAAIERLPPRLRDIETSNRPYEIVLSRALQQRFKETRARLERVQAE